MMIVNLVNAIEETPDTCGPEYNINKRRIQVLDTKT